MLRIHSLPVFCVLLFSVAPAFGQTPALSWTGFYVGVNAGFGSAEFEGIFDSDDLLVLPDSVISLEDLDVDGVVGGPHLGLNYQLGNVVVGIEADASFANLEGDTLEPSGADERATGEIDFLGSVRARGGFAVDRLFLYATAGGAYVEGNYSVVDDINADEGGPFTGSQELNQFGFVGGGGAEWAVWDHVSLRAEGLFYIFDDRQGTSDILGDPGPFESDPGDFVRLKNILVVRGGVTYRF